LRGTVPGDAELVMGGMRLRKAFGAPETLELAPSFGTGVASGLVANWLYEKLRGCPSITLRIEEQDVELEEGQIKRVLTRLIDRTEE